MPTQVPVGRGSEVERPELQEILAGFQGAGQMTSFKQEHRGAFLFFVRLPGECEEPPRARKA